MQGKRELYCNKCGKKLWMNQEILCEDALLITKKWGYFSEKDGEQHRFCLCESCYDRLMKEFVIPAEIEEIQEYL